MKPVDKEVDRVLTLLRNKIRERGQTQLQVQDSLGWGRSYISQLLTKQKSLRVEQVLMILDVIGIDPGSFYAELYRYPADTVPAYGDPVRETRALDGEVAMGSAFDGRLVHTFQESRALLQGLVQVLLDKQVVSNDELSDAAAVAAERIGDGAAEGGDSSA
ncbi:MAG: helix-turn-helix transcriptional regulator [Acidobacteriota bacterium]